MTVPSLLRRHRIPQIEINSIILEDKPHSRGGEERFILLGKTTQEKLLFIVFTIRAEKIRIISARVANRKEVVFYEKALEFANI
jgi:uncharacterized DUF497 family protein